MQWECLWREESVNLQVQCSIQGGNSKVGSKIDGIYRDYRELVGCAELVGVLRSSVCWWGHRQTVTSGLLYVLRLHFSLTPVLFFSFSRCKPYAASHIDLVPLMWSTGSKAFQSDWQILGEDHEPRPWELQCSAVLYGRRYAWSTTASHSGTAWDLSEITQWVRREIRLLPTRS